MGSNIYGVSELTGIIRGLIESDTRLSGVYVRGEISNFKLHSSGHMYFTLKDEDASIRAVMFRSDASKLKFLPGNGLKVVALGRVSVFPRDGQYQLYCSELLPDGIGALYVAFEQLKAKLQAEGLFDSTHKKPLPRYPMRIALVTSPTGAAVQDMLRILGRRFPLSKVCVFPVRVQGSEAPEEICEGIHFINEYALADVIITGRGGGSIEDLWAFNDEGVARAIYASKIPVISAVGHEPDVTIADFVADVRAATPSNAAELVVPDAMHLSVQLMNLRSRMSAVVMGNIAAKRQLLKGYAEKKALREPSGYIEERRLFLDFLERRMVSAMAAYSAAKRQRFIKYLSMLDAMSPLKVLSRGYAVVTNAEGKAVTNAKAARPGDGLDIRLQKGRIYCLVSEKEGRA